MGLLIHPCLVNLRSLIPPKTDRKRVREFPLYTSTINMILDRLGSFKFKYVPDSKFWSLTEKHRLFEYISELKNMKLTNCSCPWSDTPTPPNNFLPSNGPNGAYRGNCLVGNRIQSELTCYVVVCSTLIYTCYLYLFGILYASQPGSVVGLDDHRLSQHSFDIILFIKFENNTSTFKIISVILFSISLIGHVDHRKSIH